MPQHKNQKLSLREISSEFLKKKLLSLICLFLITIFGRQSKLFTNKFSETLLNNDALSGGRKLSIKSAKN